MTVDMNKGAELVPAEGKPIVLVDTPDERKTLHVRLQGTQRPIIAPWLRDADERRQVARLLVRRVLGEVGYHLARLPQYALLSVFYAPRGAWRVSRRGFDALFDGEGRPLRRDAVDRRDGDTYLKLRNDRRKHVRARTPAAVFVLLGVLALVVTLLVVPLWPVGGPVIAALLAVLGRIGQPADRPILQRATVASGLNKKPESEEITRALIACRVAGMTGKDVEKQISYLHPIRVDGPGWRSDIDLPYGVTPADVMEKRAELASGLRRPVGCVWPEPDHDAHGGRLVLWVGMQDMAKARPAVHPLRKSGTSDFFAPIPFGTDQRGRPVTITLFETNTLIGALPGAGKTAAIRSALVGAALDPTVELHVFEHKGSGDLESFQRIAHSYGSGVDDETIGQAAGMISYLLRVVAERAEKIKQLRARARDLVPDAKVTRELANRRGLGLHPIKAVIDEAHELFGHPEYGKQAGEEAERVIRRGRAFGVHLMLATQRPDKDSLPTGVSANVGLRFCMRVMGQVENDMILGTSAYKNGIRATMLRRSDVGIGYLKGETDEPTIVRTYYLDAAATDAIVARAYVARERAGLLTGQAAGEVVDHGETVDVLADLRTVFATAERIRTEDLLALLAELRPQVYGAWTPEALAAAVKPFGVAPTHLSIDNVKARGYRAEQVREALSRRELTGGRECL